MRYRDIYYIFDDPVPFKKLLFYPIRMKEYLEFMSYSDCLTIDKNSTQSPNMSIEERMKIISMNYLEYIITYSTMENMWIGKMDRILRICLHLTGEEHKEDIVYGQDESGKIFIKVKCGGEGGYIFIYGSDFDEIVELICDQNGIELEDYKISKEVRDALKEAENFKRRSSGSKMAGLEDQICCLIASTALTVEDISSLTVRKFSKLIQRVDMKLHYEIYLGASMSGMVEFKDKSFIKHWMSDVSKNGVNPNLIEKDKIDGKLSGK